MQRHLGTLAVLFSLSPIFLHAQQAPTSLSLSAPAPQGITQGSASACPSCTGGGQSVYYYVIARYPAGLAYPVNGIITARNTAGIGNLSNTNYIVVTWGGVSGATGYDVIRQATPGSGTSPCTGCAVTLNTSATTVNDTGQNGGNYPPNLPSVQNVLGNFSIDNQNFSVPRLLYNMSGAPSYYPAMVLGPTTAGQAAIFNLDGSLSGGTAGGGGTIPATTKTLKGDGTGNAAAVAGAGTNCVHVDGTSAACPSPGTIPSTTNVLAGDGAGNAADSKVAFVSPLTAATIQFSADNETVTLPAGTMVPNSRTVCGHALSGNVGCTASDVGLGNVTNDAQTKATIVPNTAPAAAQILVGNAGGTAYAPVAMSGSCTMTSAGVTLCTGGLAPFSCTVSGVSSITCTHNLGTSTPWVTCYDASGNMLGGTAASTSVTNVTATSSNAVAITFSGTTTGTCIITTGSTGPQGATGPAGPAGAAAVFDLYANRPNCNSGNNGVWFTATDGLYVQYCNGSTYSSLYQGQFVTPPPALSSWTAYNSASAIDDTGAVTINAPAASSTAFKALYKTFAFGSGAYTATAKVLCPTGGNDTNVFCGITLTDGTKLETLTLDTAQQLVVIDWTNATTFSATRLTMTTPFIMWTTGQMWLRYHDDGATNRTWSYSWDGHTYQAIFTTTRASFLTPTAIGPIVNSGNSNVNGASVTLLSWTEVNQ